MTYQGQNSVGNTDEWYTPPEFFDAMQAAFDMDVASPGAHIVHWIPAKRHITRDSLETQWSGFVWMNPPFGARNGLVPWLDKFFSHNNGVALVPDRTSAPWWQTYVPRSDLVLFTAAKPKFINAAGERGKQPADGVCLLALGTLGTTALKRARSKSFGSLFYPI